MTLPALNAIPGAGFVADARLAHAGKRDDVLALDLDGEVNALREFALDELMVGRVERAFAEAVTAYQRHRQPQFANHGVMLGIDVLPSPPRPMALQCRASSGTGMGLKVQPIIGCLMRP